MSYPNSLLGKLVPDLGPANVYTESDESGEADLLLTPCDSVKITHGTDQADLMEADNGTQPVDSVVTGHNILIAFGMSRATLIKLEAVQKGLNLRRDTAGNIVGLEFASAIGLRDSSVAKRLTVVEVEGGVEQRKVPGRVLHFVFAAPRTDAVELTFDAASQRYWATTFRAYRHPTATGENGAPLFYIDNGNQDNYPQLNIPDIYNPNVP
jgi:hypothetical protein